MRRLWLASLAAALVALVVSASAVSTAPGTLQITADTTLTADVYGSIVFAADNVTLDCAGYRIVGPGELPNAITVEHDGVTVQRCLVTGFEGGFDIRGSGNTFVDNHVTGALEGFGLGVGADGNTLIGNTVVGGNHGFWLVNATDNWLIGNAVSDTYTGVQINVGADDNNLIGNSSTGNADFGFLVVDADGNALTANTAPGNEVGFWVENASSTQLEWNKALHNGSGGFHVRRSDRTVFHRNVANNNGWFGFSAWNATDNTWTDNVANHNDQIGFALRVPCSGNTLTGNVARNNGAFDGVDDNAPGLNIWTGNIFGTTAGT